MENDLQKYVDLLCEIKGRKIIINNLDINGTQKYHDINVESAYLQIRKILELIAFGSLVSNIDIYSKEYENFSKFWNAERMLKDMKKVNSRFYPEPQAQKESDREGIKHDLIELDEKEYLNTEEFVKLYKKCGAIMHADNPYGSKVDYCFYRKAIPNWIEKINALLNVHKIQLVGDENLYLVRMRSNNEAPICTIFEPV
ncbi:hypothetical protein [Vibrio splendidus]|uniref:hypothetical protein n=1 Tax=Vibrio splendidus TaxID=29497 RepID=UPI0007F951CD|nr:hypothetical protein [Vibrio splendidus]OBT28585.1 hypothetical protein A9262_12465 [Vibrio splendidus]